jgi:hypothetical protein
MYEQFNLSPDFQRDTCALAGSTIGAVENPAETEAILPFS